MQPESLMETADFYHYLAGNCISDVGMYGFPAIQNNFCDNNNNNSSSILYPFEVSEIIGSTSSQSRALTASQHHKEAERRRRERINAHLDKLRTLLPACNSKMDKASLLAKVVQRVRDLKEQTSELMQVENFPSETDEITVYSNCDNSSASNPDGKLLIKASFCCDDRSDLMPDLIEMIKSFRLSPLKAEMVSLGGRIRNVIILAAEKDQISDDQSVIFLRDALKSLVHRSSFGTVDRSKRRRVIDQAGEIII